MVDDLIVLEDGIPIFNPILKVIPEFKAIIVRARKKANYAHKGQLDIATKECAYVWFMEHFGSPFKAKYPNNEVYRDEASRRVLQLLDWKALEDKLILSAREVYREDLAYRIDERLLRSARILANGLADSFEALAAVADPNAKDVSKRPQTLMKELKEVGVIIDDLKEIEDRARASEKKSNLFGKKEKNIFEDPSGSRV